MIRDMLFPSYAAKMSTKSFKSASKKFEFCTSGFAKASPKREVFCLCNFMLHFKIGD
jgi:hypothetical protein